MATYKLVDEEKLDAAMTATADAIRAKTGSTDPIAWDSEKGMSEAVDPVFEAGKKAEYDAFWDAFQMNGKKQSYPYGFYNWKEGTIKPKYDITIKENSGGGNAFAYVRQKKLNFKIIVNMMLATNPSVNGLFMHSSIEEINYLEIKENVLISDWFIACTALKTINVYGTIGSDGFDIHWSTLLSKASILSIINALSDTTTGLTVTLSLTAVNNAFETSTGAADGSTSEEWAALIATKPNWTISLA